MSSSIDSESESMNEPKSISSFEHAGTLVQHVEIASSDALRNFVSKCSKEGRRVISSRPFNLPEKPAHRIDYFLTSSAQNVIEHFRPDQVISVEAGITIRALQTLLAEYKQWFPIYVHDEDISLMEYINSGNSGPLEHGFGEARDLVLGMMVVLGTGELIKCGGKVVKNVTGYDLPKLFAGSHGTLAVPFSAHLRLFALPETSSTVIFEFATIAGAMAASKKLRRSGLPLSCLEIFSANAVSISAQKLPEAFSSFSNGAACLAVEIHGIKTVVEELQRESIALAGASHRVIGDAEARLLWNLLSKPYAKVGNNWVEMSGPLSVMEAILLELGSESDIAWTVRSGRNKMCIYSTNEMFSRVNEIARKVLSTNKERLVLACSDASFTWKVYALPAEDAVLNELKHRVKREFDPSDVLNPLAEL